MKLEVYDQTGKRSGSLPLPEEVFGRRVSEAVLLQYLRVYGAHQHQGTSKVKTRAEVRGGGRKPWRQKGTGRARHGSLRSPLWVGGGVAHGPKPHPKLKLNKKVKRLALLSALREKLEGKRILILEPLRFEVASTRKFVRWQEKLPVEGKTLLVLSAPKPEVYLSARNLPETQVVLVGELNAYEVLRCDTLLVERGAWDKLMERFSFRMSGRRESKGLEEVEVKLTELGLSKRLLTALSKSGVHTLADLRALSSEELLALKGVGSKSLLEIREVLRNSSGSS